MRTPFVRTLGLVWLLALAVTVLAAMLNAAVAIMPGLPVPLALAEIAMLVAAVLALLATPLALAPGQALAASLGAGGAWGTDRADLWGTLARAAAACAPETGEVLPVLPASLRREAASASQALQAAMEDAARIDDAARDVEARLAHGLRLVENVAAQLAAAGTERNVAAGGGDRL